MHMATWFDYRGLLLYTKFVHGQAHGRGFQSHPRQFFSLCLGRVVLCCVALSFIGVERFSIVRVKAMW